MAITTIHGLPVLAWARPHHAKRELVERAFGACLGFGIAAFLGFGIAAFLTLREEPKDTEPGPAYVSHALQFRLSTPLEKGRGDRYRSFDCREVNR